MDRKEVYDFFRLINFGNAKQRATIITLITEDSNDLSCFLNFFKDLKIYIVHNNDYEPFQYEMVNNDFIIYSYRCYPNSFRAFEISDFVITFSNGIFYILKNRFDNTKEIDINGILRKEKLDTLLSSF